MNCLRITVRIGWRWGNGAGCVRPLPPYTRIKLLAQKLLSGRDRAAGCRNRRSASGASALHVPSLVDEQNQKADRHCCLGFPGVITGQIDGSRYGLGGYRRILVATMMSSLAIVSAVHCDRDESWMTLTLPFSACSDLPAMADFPINPEWMWLLTIMPLTGGVFLFVAAIAGPIAIFMGSTRAPRARSVAFRTAVLALGPFAFPLIPLALLKRGVDLDYDLVVVLFWLSVLFLAFGCWWLGRPA